MANVMSLKKLKNRTSRNGFDLSKRNIFSAKVGELLPVYCKEVLPGDKFKINVSSFTRTMPVNTAAYTRIKEYYDWYFVPTNLLWNKFNTFVTQMTSNVQHASSIGGADSLTSQHPYFTLEQVYEYLDQLKVNSEQLASKNIFGFDRYETTRKLLEYLGYSDFSAYTQSGEWKENFAMNPFPLLAYQKIYSDYYRDSQWENNAAETYNIDYIKGNNDLNLPISDIKWANELMSSPIYNMFDLRYSSWNKDLIFGVKPNAQFGDAASVDLSSILNPRSLSSNLEFSSSDTSLSDVQIKAGSNQRMLQTANGQTLYPFYSESSVKSLAEAMGLRASNLSSAFSILALRQAEALQKWKEITQSQQQDYKSQIEAHFGVNLSNAYSERCHYIDGFSDVIDINEVVNTNLRDGDTANIADIAGKGVGVNDGYTNFSSDVHGYIMCIYHAVPLMDYSMSTRIDRQNLKTMVTDYAIPELDKTGMVALPLSELSNLPSNMQDLLGYVPRYYDYKTDIDVVHGSARNKNSAWVAPLDDAYFNTYIMINHKITWDFFKVNPAILDPIFAASANADSSVDSDQLLTNCSFKIKCVRNLDYDGLPY